MNRLLYVALTAFVIVSPLHAGRVEDQGEKTVIRLKVFRLPDPGRTDAFNRAELEAVRAFVKRFPSIFEAKYRRLYSANPARYGEHNWDKVEIVLEEFTGISVEGVETDLLAIAGGVAPDVLYVNFRKSHNYIFNGFLYPLDKPDDPYLSSMSEDELSFRVHPAIWPVIRRKGPEGERRVWAMPYGGALGKVLMYRKDLFDEHGLEYPDAEWTWEDLLNAARVLTKPSEGIYGIRLGRSKHESAHWITFLWSAGGEVMEYDETKGQWKCVFDGPQAALALDFYTRLIAEEWTDDSGRTRRGYSTRDVSGSYQKWQRGEVGMMIAYMDEKLFATVNPEVTGLAPVPLGPGGKRGAELNSRMMGIFAGIEEPAVRDAAWEFIRFYDSREAMRIKTRIMVEGGYGRFINPRYLRMFGYHGIERLSPPGWARTYDIAVSTGHPEPYGKNSNVAYDLMTRPIRQAEQLARDGDLPVDSGARLEVMQELLSNACSLANRKMMGIVDQREKRLRGISAGGMLGAIVIAFLFLFRRVARAFAPLGFESGGTGRQFRKYAWAYALLAPAVLTIFTWRYIPLIRGSVMAFLDYRLMGGSKLVWLDNFGSALFDAEWWTAVWNSVRFSLLVMALTFLPPIALAVFLQETKRGRLFFRTVFYLPAVISGIVTILLWKQFYEPSENGALNSLVMNIPAGGFWLAGGVLCLIALRFAWRLWLCGARPAAAMVTAAGLAVFYTCVSVAMPIVFPEGESLGQSLPLLHSRLLDGFAEPFNWLTDKDTAMLACVIPMAWAGMGPGCLIYLAALKSISDEYYEAAEMDGAGFADKILFVIVPTLRPLIVINFVGIFINSWYQATGSILAMTGGEYGTETAGLHVWYKAFTFLKFGEATAMAWMLGFMLIGFTVYQLQMLSRVEFKAQG